MDFGGIQRIVQIWIHGDQTNATLTVDNGTYTLDYTDENGEDVHQAGGGVAFNEDGYCYVKLEAGEETKYMTVEYSDSSCGGLGYGLSTHAFLQPNEFGVGYDGD